MEPFPCTRDAYAADGLVERRDAGQIPEEWYCRALINTLSPGDIVNWFRAAVNRLDVEIDGGLCVSIGGGWMTQSAIDACVEIIDRGV